MPRRLAGTCQIALLSRSGDDKRRLLVRELYDGCIQWIRAHTSAARIHASIEESPNRSGPADRGRVPHNGVRNPPCLGWENATPHACALGAASAAEECSPPAAAPAACLDDSVQQSIDGWPQKPRAERESAWGISFRGKGGLPVLPFSHPGPKIKNEVERASTSRRRLSIVGSLDSAVVVVVRAVGVGVVSPTNTTTHTTPKAKARSIPSHTLGLTTIPTIPFILQVGLVGPAGLFDRSTNAVGCPASYHNSTTPRPRSFKLTQQQAAAVWPPSTSAPWPPPSPPWP